MEEEAHRITFMETKMETRVVRDFVRVFAWTAHRKSDPGAADRVRRYITAPSVLALSPPGSEPTHCLSTS